MANANTAIFGCHRCASAEHTHTLGAALGQSLDAPACIALEGPLGAGKTIFVRGLAEGLASADEVTSPTFAIAHEYQGGRLPLFHFDFYRMEHPSELQTAGFAECLGEGVVAAEWAGKFVSFLPADSIRVTFRIRKDGVRSVSIT
jgi:tRNA threonylcarbamoyladenosine biosynthesis protein TsaE